MTRKLSTLIPVALAAAPAGCVAHEFALQATGADSSRNAQLPQPDRYSKGAAGALRPLHAGEHSDLGGATGADGTDHRREHPGQHEADRSRRHAVRGQPLRPQPAAHYKLGPTSLRNTLQVLAGPACQVKVDEIMRSVCFELRPGYQLPEGQRYAAAPAATPTTATNIPAPVSSTGMTIATVPAAKPLERHPVSAKPIPNVASGQAVKPTPASAALTSAPVNAPGEVLHVRQSPNASLAKGTSTSPAAVMT